ncbi:GH92 family glycosyl hydrolase [Arthrobacter gengyunqii]|uniref:GH92 family glycosyl hydrolase n=1 Tax=Arthrobacter gengyunqii TaxID=2886940 RepID=A0ABS8GLT2_9MICC|nr:GH92 family glycosyl hydrolase [Arthrobacter gengyunqii]
MHTPHPALAVTIDVVFDDGTRLSGDGRVRDRYGVPMTASAQFKTAWAMPEQWNADSVSLEPWAGRTANLEVVLGTSGLSEEPPAKGLVEGFIEVIVSKRAATVASGMAMPTPAERVDTRRGSHSGARFSRGNTIPITAVPHGFCFLSPATNADDTRWPYRWSAHDHDHGRPLTALQFSHQPSPWIGDRGVLQVRPFIIAPGGTPPYIVPGTEFARPHLYAAQLHGGAFVEMTATSHGGIFRIAADASSDIVGFSIGAPQGAGRVTFHDNGTFDGWTPEGAADWGNPPRAYFAGRILDESSVDGRAVTASGALEVRIAQSFLSVDQARRSLAQELPVSRSFEAVRESLHAEWNGLLSAVELPEASPAERQWRGLADDDARAQIASALYRLHLYPNTTAENTGTVEVPRLRFANPMVRSSPHGEATTGAPVEDGDLHVNNGYWDTYRTVWPALALFDPEGAGRMLDGLLQQACRGGWMARWSAPGYVDSMVGTSSDQIFADANRWAVPFDEQAAFETAWRNACEPSADPRQGRKGIARGRFTGYISSDVSEGMSWSIENAISDAAIGRFASRLAAQGTGSTARWAAYARYFGNRALSYRTLFDPAHGFFRGKNAAGRFSETFDPRDWGGDNVETNGWGMSVSSVHDGAGLAALHGGRGGLRAHLDRLFAEPETGDVAFAGHYGVVIHEQREARAQRSGMCALSNQPAHHIPWMHVHGDRPWRAGALVHRLAGRLFAGAMIGQGFPGDEDNGEMSMWWLWAALGLYPLELGSGELHIGSPLFDDIRVRRANGGSLRVRAFRPHPDAHYLVSATLAGVPLERATLSVDALKGDVELELVFTPDASEAAASPLWAEEMRATLWQPDLTRNGGHPLDSSHAALFDDGAASETALRTASAGWVFSQTSTVTDVTITAAADTAADAYVWQTSDSGKKWRDVATTHREMLIAGRTTPFTFAEPVTARMLRVRAVNEPVTLRQLELFNLGHPSC